MSSPYNQLSGFESDALNEFGNEGFLEALQSELAVDVQLCNYDLSDCKEIRAIIQNNHQDTKLKTLSRMMFVPIGTCKAGMYVKYKNRYWLITGLVDDNKVFEKAILLICNYKLSWINKDRRIVQRWVNAESASQYNNGETNMRYYFVRSDQLMVYMPDDVESLLLDSGARFIVDKRCSVYEKQFDSSVTKDTSNPLIVYDITRNDSVLDNYTDSGIIGYIFTQTEQKSDDGYYVVDGIGYWLCTPPFQNTRNKELSCEIMFDSDELFIGLDPEVFTAVFYDGDGNKLSNDNLPIYNFSINCDFSDKLDFQTLDNSILISTYDHSLNNKSFKLKLSADGYNSFESVIKIREFL